MLFKAVSTMALATAAMALPRSDKISSRQNGNGGNGSGNGNGNGNGRNGNLGGILPATVDINTRTNNPALISQVMLAATQAERFAVLDQPGDYIFDFNDRTIEGQGTAVGNGGFSVGAQATSFPALIGNGLAMTVAYVDACGMNTPHVHNRATEMLIATQGRFATNFVQENGIDARSNVIDTYQAALFPQGAIHAEYNPDCEQAIFVAAFSEADPGVSQIAQNFYALESNVLSAVLGGVQSIAGSDLESFRDMIPDNIAAGVEECLNRCGIQRNPKRSLEDLAAQYKK